MLIITPYIAGIADYKTLAANMRKCGPLVTHIHRVVSSVDDQDAAFAFGEEVGDLFMKSSHVAIVPSAAGRINLANEMFRSAVRWVAGYQSAEGEIPNPPALYMDPTYRPLRAGWLDTIQTEFYMRGAPMTMGELGHDDEGAAVYTGPFVFSRNFASNSSLVNFLPPDVHYRKYMRWEFSKNPLATALIGATADSVLRPTPKPGETKAAPAKPQAAKAATTAPE